MVVVCLRASAWVNVISTDGSCIPNACSSLVVKIDSRTYMMLLCIRREGLELSMKLRHQSLSRYTAQTNTTEPSPIPTGNTPLPDAYHFLLASLA